MDACPAFSYREVGPNAQLACYVECYWFLTGSPGPSLDSHRILPDGCMEIVVNLGAPIRRVQQNGAVEIQPRQMLVGQMDQHVTIQPTGPLDVVGIRFQPAGAFAFLRFPLHQLRNQTVRLDDVLTHLHEGLCERLMEASTTALRVSVIESSLLARLSQAPPRDLLLESAARCVIEEAGQITVDALAHESRVSPRELERRFRERIGVGPKRLCRIVRFQDVLRRHGLAEDAWVGVALDCGYYDQPHFIREFKRITGETPPKFFSRLDPVTRFFTRTSR